MRPRDFPTSVIAKHRAIENAPHQARKALRLFPQTYRRQLERACFGFERALPRDCSALRTRRIIALATSLWALSHRSKRHGFHRVTVGFTESMYAWLCWNPRTGKPCTRSTVTATSWGAQRRRADECGILVALERAFGDGDVAMLFAQQPRADLADERYTGPPKIIGYDELGAPIRRRFAFVVIWWRHIATPLRVPWARPAPPR